MTLHTLQSAPEGAKIGVALSQAEAKLVNAFRAMDATDGEMLSNLAQCLSSRHVNGRRRPVLRAITGGESAAMIAAEAVTEKGGR